MFGLFWLHPGQCICVYGDAFIMVKSAIDSNVVSAPASIASLPCLYNNISIEILSVTARRSAFALGFNVKYFAQKFGLDNIGFLTLTFADHITDFKEAQRRLNSLLSNVIKLRYVDYIGVKERQRSGRIHFHLLVHVGFDIRSGFDFSAVSNQDYSSASAAIRKEWSFWRMTAKKYGFGRTELMPIKSSEEAIGKYIGKYIGKHLESRLEEDKNARLVLCSRGARIASTRFQFVSEGSKAWRSKLGAFVHMVSERSGCDPTLESVAELLGPRWCYRHRDFILSMPDGV
jgi:hypothetical protein